MRIVAGRHRGAKLAAPEDLSVRPTADRTRESLFGVLEGGRHGEVLDGALVVDVFAGTGALGLEALSRGAERVVFIERSHDTARILRANIAKLKAEAATTVIEGDVASLHRRSETPAALVLMDPPYRSGLAGPALEALRRTGWIGEDTLVVVECEKAEDPALPDWLEPLDERRYGKAKLTFARPRPAAS